MPLPFRSVGSKTFRREFHASTERENLSATRERFLYYQKRLVVDCCDPCIDRRLFNSLYLEDTAYLTFIGKLKRFIKKPLLPRQYYPQRSDQIFLYLANRNSSGYFHFITELLTTLVWLTDQDIVNYQLVLPSILKVDWVLQFLAIFEVGEVCWLDSRSLIHHCWIAAATAIQGSYDGSEIRKLRCIMHQRFLESATPAAPPPSKIIISREDADSRRLINHQSLYLKLKDLGFETFLLSELSVEEQVFLFARATHVVAPHGAGLTNMIWMQEKSYVYEIRAHENANDNCYFALSQHLNIQYTAIEGYMTECGDYVLSDDHINSLVDCLVQGL